MISPQRENEERPHSRSRGAEHNVFGLIQPCLLSFAPNQRMNSTSEPRGPR